MKLFDLFANIQIDTKTATNSIKALKKDVTNLGSAFTTLGKAGLNAGSAIASGMMKAGTVVTAGATAVGALGMNFNSSMEQTETSFTVFLGSAEKAKKMVKDLSVLAKDTPFEMEELNKSSTMLLNYGIAQDKVIPTMKMLGDIAMGDKEKLGGLSMALGQVKGNGRLMGEELNQMIERGFNPLENIAKKTGKSMADLREEMSDGLISYDMVEQAIIDATSAGGKFNGSMNAMSKTFKGQMSTLSDNANQAFGVVMLPLFNLLSNKVLPFLNQNLGNMATIASDKMQKLKSLFFQVLPDIKGIIEQLKPTIKSVFGYLTEQIIPKAIELFKSFFSLLNDNMPIIKAVIKTSLVFAIGLFKMFVENVKFLIDNFKILLPIMIAVVATFKAFQIITIIVGLWKAFQAGTLLATLAQWGLNIAMYASPIGWLALAIGVLIGVIAFLILNFDSVKNVFGILCDYIVIKWNSIVAFFKVAVDAIVQVFKSLWEAVKSYFMLYTVIVGIVVDFIKNAFVVARDFIVNAFNYVTSKISSFADGIKSIFYNIRDAITGAFKSAVNFVISGINAMIGAVNSFKIKVPDFVPFIGGKTWNGFGIPKVPYLAEGGNITKSGLAMVGENGAELLNLPKGASVTPLSKTGTTINIIEPKIFKTSDIDDLMNTITKRMKLANVGR